MKSISERLASAELVEAILGIRESGQFDSDYYAQHYAADAPPDLDFVEHYVLYGSPRGYRPKPDFEPALYRARYEDSAASHVDPFWHYLKLGAAWGRRGDRTDEDVADYELIRNSELFDQSFYCNSFARYPANIDPVDHYLYSGARHHVDPGPDFDAAFYMSQCPELMDTGRAPLVHYLREGRYRGFATKSADTTIRWMNPGLKRPDDDITVERLRGSSFFFRNNVPRDDGSADHWRPAVDNLANRKPAQHLLGKPLASIIIPVYGQLPFVLNCLESLVLHRAKTPFEIIVLDDASPEEAEVEQISAIPWIRYRRLTHNQGFIGACNEAAKLACGDILVFLNSDTRICQGWLDELVNTFRDRPNAGFVGSKLFNDDGSLQEAGAIVWNDGSAWNYGRNDDPNLPKYCYARQVDYCSGAAIAVPADLWGDLGGFDAHYAPAYYEDVDLCFKVRSAGREVWLQPLAKVIHYEGKTHGRDEAVGIKAYQAANAKKFAARWSHVLESHSPNGFWPEREADRCRPKRMLAIDALTPTPDQDAGSVMSARLIEIYEKLGWRVSFYAAHDPSYQFRYTDDLMRAGIEPMLAPQIGSLEHILSTVDNFDVILVFRVTVLHPLINQLRARYPAALILFHDIDLHYLRMEREAAMLGDDALLRKAQIVCDQEYDLIASVDCTIVPSSEEKNLIQDQVPVDNVVVYPYTAEVVPNAIGFSERRHLAFVGGFRHAPNVDAMHYFVAEIWPSLCKALPDDVKLFIIGAEAPPSVKGLSSDRIVLTGYLEDLSPVLDQCRIFVAPLRYGAGLKGKVVTSLSHGIPCVASSIAVEGMGLRDGIDVIVADDAADFVRAVERLYADEAAWVSQRAAGHEFVLNQYSWDAGMKLGQTILEAAREAWLRRRRANRIARLGKILAPVQAPSVQS